jgi:hypothetical protein
MRFVLRSQIPGIFIVGLINLTSWRAKRVLLVSNKHLLNDAPHVQAQPLVIYTSTKMDDAFVAALQKKGEIIGRPQTL